MTGKLTRSLMALSQMATARLLACVAVCGVLISLPSVLRADDKVSESNTKAALAFAKEHHPELADLLEQLRKNAPKEYAAAISDLDRSRQRIERNKSSSERYRLELDEWKMNSRIRLLVARLAMGQDATIESELRSSIEQRNKIRIELLQEERTRLKQRIEKIDDQIAQQKSRAADQVEKELATLVKSTTVKSTAVATKRSESSKAKNTTNAKTPVNKSTPNKTTPNKTSADKPDSSPDKTSQDKTSPSKSQKSSDSTSNKRK